MLKCFVAGLRGIGENSKGGVHLDLKPGNVYLGLDEDKKWDGQLVIADFGIGDLHVGKHKCGTAGFGSAEQFSFQADQSSDVYSTAKVFQQYNASFLFYL